MALKIIGAGFGRTGTDSMREALTILGFGACHHMLEVFGNPVQTAQWRAVAAGGVPDWKAMFDGYQSAVDWPSAFYWRELMAFYPDAHVLLTDRSAESWWESFAKTLLLGLAKSTDPQSLGIALIANQVFGGNPTDRSHAIACYNANVAAVKASVPPERLIVHTLGDGWPNLCARLGVKVPDQLYPSRNSADDFQTKVLSRLDPGAANQG